MTDTVRPVDDGRPAGDARPTDFSASISARVREFDGETPLQVLARQGGTRPSPLSSLERFPYYRAFPYSWYFAAFSADVGAGEVHTARWLARDLVIWRAEDGTPHVMDAYCPHMGAHLGYGGRVEGCNLVCLYHWWEYDGAGNNVRIPYADRPNGAAKVRSYPTIDRNGLIMFWYHPRGELPAWEIPEIPELADPAWADEFRCEWDVRCPWQEMAENGPDYVHLRTVHGAASVPEVESLTYDGPFSHLRTKVQFATPRGPQDGRIDTDGWGPGFAVARFSGITPALFVNLTTPIDWEHTRSIKLYRVQRLGDTEEDRARVRRVGEALVRDLRKQMDEDIVIFDHKVWVDPPALAPDDGPIVRFRRWAAQFYVDGDPLAADRGGFSARSRSPGDRKRAENPAEPADEQYRIADDDETARREYERLRVLGRWRDPATIAALEATGVTPGWRCLEVGAGAGTISAWMAERVGPDGYVLSTDVDLRFHGEPIPPTEVVQHDITRDPLPEASFDLVHARAVLQHVAERELALERMIAALKPGGWIVVEEADMRAFEAQPLPEPLATLHRMMCAAAAQQEYREPNFGTRLLRLLQEHGLTDVSARGLVETMRAGEDSAEWWFLAVEHVRDRIIGAGVMSADDFDAALSIARTPGFIMLGPVSIQVSGRKP